MADPDQDTAGCKKKPNEPSFKQAIGCDLMSDVFDIEQNLNLLNSFALIFVKLMSDLRLLAAIPGENGSINPVTFGSYPVLLFKRLKSQAFIDLSIQTPSCANFVNNKSG